MLPHNSEGGPQLTPPPSKHVKLKGALLGLMNIAAGDKLSSHSIEAVPVCLLCMSDKGVTLVHGLGSLLIGAADIIGLHLLQSERVVVNHAVDVLHAVHVRQDLPEAPSHSLWPEL